MQILIIEPDRLLATSYQSVLQQAGHPVQTAHNAQTAIHQIDQQRPEVIVLELQMSNHNGAEFLYELRSYPEWQSIPVVIHSFIPKRQLPNSQRLDELGVVGQFYKPTTSLRRLTTFVGQLQTAPVPVPSPA